MVKQGSSTFSATSVAKGSVVLSRAIEKNFALEAEISRLRHHVSVLSRWLHLVTVERDGLQDMVVGTMEFEEEWGRTPLGGDEVARMELDGEAEPSVAGEEEEESHDVAMEEEVKEAAPSVAGMLVEESHSVAGEREKEAELAVADEAGGREENTADRMEEVEFVAEMARDCNRFRLDLVVKEDSVLDPLIPSCVDGLVMLRKASLEEEGGWPALGSPRIKEIDRKKGVMRSLGSSGDEDTIIGGVIVAGGASQKAKNAARRGKRKNRRSEASGWNGGW